MRSLLPWLSARSTRSGAASPVPAGLLGRKHSGRRDAGQAQPLPGGGVAILHPGVPDVARLQPQAARQQIHRVQRRQATLFDPHEGVLANPRRRIGWDLLDDERVGRGAKAADTGSGDQGKGLPGSNRLEKSALSVSLPRGAPPAEASVASGWAFD